MHAGPFALSMVQRRGAMKEMLADVSGIESFPGIDKLAAFLKANPLIWLSYILLF